jgi:hypothetical protein
VSFPSPRIDRIWITRSVCRSFRLCTDWGGVRRLGVARNPATTTIGRSSWSCPVATQTQGAGIDIEISDDTIRLSPVTSTAQSSTETSAQYLNFRLVPAPTLVRRPPPPFCSCGLSLHFVMPFVTLVTLVILSPRHAPHGTTDERAGGRFSSIWGELIGLIVVSMNTHWR